MSTSSELHESSGTVTTTNHSNSRSPLTSQSQDSANSGPVPDSPVDFFHDGHNNRQGGAKSSLVREAEAKMRRAHNESEITLTNHSRYNGFDLYRQDVASATSQGESPIGTGGSVLRQ
eukprot:CAMPEP_0170460218 /NCGR_PEP_ID=MMETSP0123-20130129/6672_1 /TAXON_ID=182087 /ORGANISM="Favella ehrenbergii, Strain Fehren 1" /LENGTH=117 /DNA_ID=CAMNT_0010725115 /DNA_START=17 /DNA_END=370 /DNA_ORIENTATION=-